MASIASHPKKIHIDEDTGKDDPSTSGTEEQPFKSLAFAYIHTDGQAEYVSRKSVTGAVAEGSDKSTLLEYKPAAKAGLKKAANALQSHKKKAAREGELAAQRQKEEEARQLALEEAKKIVIKEDTSLPKAFKIRLDHQGSDLKLTDKDTDTKGTRVRVLGRVHRLRKQKDVIFVELKDGYGKMQCVFTGDFAKTYDALTLTQETSLELYGELWKVPAGAHAPLDRELHLDFFKVIHKAPGGDDAISTRVAPDADPTTKLDLRHLTLRGDTSSSVLLVRSAVEFAFNCVYSEMRFRKVSPPALVQTQAEGGSDLFDTEYYGEKAYLTQSSQLYLETCLASLGNVYCIEKSFRAEKSDTRRHLSEYTHIEAELDFITFDDLMDHLEELLCSVLKKVLSDPEISTIIYKLNPDFKVPEQPFLRLKYKDAIDWLNKHNILNEEGKPHAFGDDIAEAAERKMTDIINKPIFLTGFPVEIKAFYMQKDAEDRRVTESMDVLMPGVGEIVGGSMRMWDSDELLEAYKKEGIDPKDYYWYTDQRKYGSSPHGGYGIGLERFLAWLCNQYTVRDTCLYPRYMGRCKP